MQEKARSQVRALAEESVARSWRVRNGVLAAACLPDAADALTEIQLVARQGLVQAWDATASTLDLVESVARDDLSGAPEVLPEVLSALADEVRWLTGLDRLAHAHLSPSVSSEAKRDALDLLVAALRRLA